MRDLVLEGMGPEAADQWLRAALRIREVAARPPTATPQREVG
jgi:hypothetical protein